MDKPEDVPIDHPPNYGLKFRLNHEFPLQSKQVISPTVKQAFELVPLTIRYFAINLIFISLNLMIILFF